jgi:hypothetical protein
MSPSEQLEKAKALLSDPARWTKGTFARTERGIPVSAESPLAVSWCAEGAMRACRQDAPMTIGLRLLGDTVPDPWEWVTDYNDNLSKTMPTSWPGLTGP